MSRQNVRNCSTILTHNGAAMSTIPRSILSHAESLPEGGLMSPKEFLHLGSRAAVDQAFSRLTKEGKLSLIHI